MDHSTGAHRRYLTGTPTTACGARGRRSPARTPVRRASRPSPGGEVGHALGVRPTDTRQSHGQPTAHGLGPSEGRRLRLCPARRAVIRAPSTHAPQGRPVGGMDPTDAARPGGRLPRRPRPTDFTAETMRPSRKSAPADNRRQPRRSHRRPPASTHRPPSPRPRTAAASAGAAVRRRPARRPLPRRPRPPDVTADAVRPRSAADLRRRPRTAASVPSAGAAVRRHPARRPLPTPPQPTDFTANAVGSRSSGGRSPRE